MRTFYVSRLGSTRLHADLCYRVNSAMELFDRLMRSRRPYCLWEIKRSCGRFGGRICLATIGCPESHEELGDALERACVEAWEGYVE